MRLPDFFSRRQTPKSNTKVARSVATIDKTENLVVDHNLTYGLYHNSAPGYKLAGALAYNPIAVPVAFMGVPSVTCENEVTQKRITDLIKDFFTQMSQIHTQCHRDGTVWVFPFFSTKDRQLHWEYIPDESVYKIIKDVDTNEIISIITKETITINKNNLSDETMSTTRYKTFTKTKIVEQYLGEALPADIHNSVRMNTSGILPIPFSNNPELGEVRGHSDYERLVPDFKNYHDTELARSTILAQFKPKMIINLQSANPDTFMENNGWHSIGDVNVADIDMIITTGEDKITFEYPGSTATSAYSEALATGFHKLVEGSGVPEIAWGLKTTGNSNSSEESMATLLNFVRAKQGQKTVCYEDLFVASLRILSIAEMTQYDTDIKVEWGTLDGISMVNKAQIFANVTAAMKNIVDGSSASKEMVLKMWQMFYPEETEGDIEKYKKGLSEMAKHKQFSNAQYSEIMDYDTDGNEGIDMSKMPTKKASK